MGRTRHSEAVLCDQEVQVDTFAKKVHEEHFKDIKQSCIRRRRRESASSVEETSNNNEEAIEN